MKLKSTLYVCCLMLCACYKPMNSQEAIEYYTKHFGANKQYYQQLYSLLDDTCLTRYDEVAVDYLPKRPFDLYLIIDNANPKPFAPICSINKQEEIINLWEKINDDLYMIYYFKDVSGKKIYFEMQEFNEIGGETFVIFKYSFQTKPEMYDTINPQKYDWSYYLGDGFYLWSPKPKKKMHNDTPFPYQFPPHNR